MEDLGFFLWRVSKQMMDIIEAQTLKPNRPYVEVMDREESLLVTAEMSEVEPDDIRVDVSENAVSIRILTGSVTTYKKKIPSIRLDKDNPLISYKNQILKVDVPHI